MITAFEASTLYDALRTVLQACGRANKAEEEIESIMGGEILEFSADKYYYEGERVGYSNGEKNGFSNGERNRLIANLKIVMEKLDYDLDEAMDFLDVDSSEREALRVDTGVILV